MSSMPMGKYEPPSSSSSAASIGKAVKVVGQIYSREDLYVDGEIEGTVEALEHKLTIGPNGAVRAGVKMTFGTDAGVCPHGINARQLAFMVKYGMTPMQAIQSATINAATLIGKPEQFGSIRAGKFADVIAVDGDPIADVRQLEHVTFVMKQGVVYKP